jgi:monofunctional biosynthetic peptidoglycan transglycosylase
MTTMAKSLFLAFFFGSLMACSSGPGCSPKFTDLKKKYPHVVNHGPREPSEVVLRDSPPAHWTPLAQIPKGVRGAILVSEDWSFYDHPGYDESEIREAVKESIEEGHLTRGASTITQQVVRNIYLTKEKSLTRKIREIWMATKVEKVVGKNRILELYLNLAEMGEGIFGIGHASQYYFQKPPSALRPKEAAFLAMLLPSPKRYSISFRQKQLTPYARRIIRNILNKMVKGGFLTPEQREQEWATPLPFEARFDASIPKEDASGEEEELANEEADESTGAPSEKRLKPEENNAVDLQSR